MDVTHPSQRMSADELEETVERLVDTLRERETRLTELSSTIWLATKLSVATHDELRAYLYSNPNKRWNVSDLHARYGAKPSREKLRYFLMQAVMPVYVAYPKTLREAEDEMTLLEKEVQTRRDEIKQYVDRMRPNTAAVYRSALKSNVPWTLAQLRENWQRAIQSGQEEAALRVGLQEMRDALAAINATKNVDTMSSAERADLDTQWKHTLRTITEIEDALEPGTFTPTNQHRHPPWREAWLRAEIAELESQSPSESNQERLSRLRDRLKRYQKSHPPSSNPKVVSPPTRMAPPPPKEKSRKELFHELGEIDKQIDRAEYVWLAVRLREATPQELHAYRFAETVPIIPLYEAHGAQPTDDELRRYLVFDRMELHKINLLPDSLKEADQKIAELDDKRKRHIAEIKRIMAAAPTSWDDNLIRQLAARETHTPAVDQVRADWRAAISNGEESGSARALAHHVDETQQYLRENKAELAMLEQTVVNTGLYGQNHNERKRLALDWEIVWERIASNEKNLRMWIDLARAAGWYRGFGDIAADYVFLTPPHEPHKLPEPPWREMWLRAEIAYAESQLRDAETRLADFNQRPRATVDEMRRRYAGKQRDGKTVPKNASDPRLRAYDEEDHNAERASLQTHIEYTKQNIAKLRAALDRFIATNRPAGPPPKNKSRKELFDELDKLAKELEWRKSIWLVERLQDATSQELQAYLFYEEALVIQLYKKHGARPTDTQLRNFLIEHELKSYRGTLPGSLQKAEKNIIALDEKLTRHIAEIKRVMAAVTISWDAVYSDRLKRFETGISSVERVHTDWHDRIASGTKTRSLDAITEQINWYQERLQEYYAILTTLEKANINGMYDYQRRDLETEFGVVWRNITELKTYLQMYTDFALAAGYQVPNIKPVVLTPKREPPWREAWLRAEIGDAEAKLLEAETTLADFNREQPQSVGDLRERYVGATRDGRTVAKSVSEKRLRAFEQEDRTRDRTYQERSVAQQREKLERLRTALERFTAAERPEKRSRVVESKLIGKCAAPNCGAPSIAQCGGCARVTYCGEACQARDWEHAHARQCK